MKIQDIPIGMVIINDNVEIGSSNTIDEVHYLIL